MKKSNTQDQGRRYHRLSGLCLLLGGSLLAASVMDSSARAAPAATPPHLDIDLDAFDASKKLMVLPDGESLAYIDRGERSGSAVVLIHGYTDNARDWVPMLPYLSKHYRLILVDIRGQGGPASRSAVTPGSTLPMTSSCCWTRSACRRRISSGIPWAASSPRRSPNTGRNEQRTSY